MSFTTQEYNIYIEVIFKVFYKLYSAVGESFVTLDVTSFTHVVFFILERTSVYLGNAEIFWNRLDEQEDLSVCNS